MNEGQALYKISFRVLYRISKNNDRFAELAFRSVTKLPIDTGFTLDPTNFLSFEEFSMKYHDLFITPDEKISIYLENKNTGKVINLGLSFKKDWVVPKSWRVKIGRSGSVDITNAINSLLRG